MDSSKLKDCEDDHNPLMCVFMEYFWDEKENEYPGCLNMDLITWIRSQNLNISDEHWYFSSKLDVRVTKKNEVSDTSMEANVDLLQQISKNERLCAKLVFAMRKILPMLIACNGDVNYRNDHDQTFLHLFIEGYFDAKDNYSQDQTIRLERHVKNLISLGVSFYVNDKNAKTPIDIAYCKNYDLLNIIVSNLSDVEARDQNGNTLLHILLNNSVDEVGNLKDEYKGLVLRVVSKSVKGVNAKNEDGVTPSHLCAGKFHYEILKILANNGADFNIKTNCGQIPLHFACNSTLKLKDSSKAVSVVDFLAILGNLEAVDMEGYAPLHYASEFASVDVVRKLITRGALVDARTIPLLLTPLYLSAKSDRLDNMQVLIEAGANVNAEALDGTTPIFMSAMLGSYESLLYLIGKGADLHGRDNVLGFTLMHMAANSWDFNPQVDDPNNFDTSEKKQHLTKVSAIIDKGFDLNDLAMCGIAPIHLAIIRRNIINVRILINNEANVNLSSDGSKMTPIHLAAIENQCEIGKMLVEKAADLNCRGGVENMTALHMALATDIRYQLGKYPTSAEARKDESCVLKFWPETKETRDSEPCVPLVSLLIEHEADVNIKDSYGRTTLHYASRHRSNAAMRKLLQAQAQVNVQDNDGRLPVNNILERGNANDLQLLLDFGVDIDEDDVSELIINSNNEIKNIAIRHAIKLDLLNLNIAKAYKPLVQSPEFANFRRECSEEVKRITTYRKNGCSSSNFLYMNRRRQQLYAERVERRLNKIRKHLPMYASLISASGCECIRRRPLLKSARSAWIGITKIRLPEVCIDIIFDHLNNRNLDLFAYSASNDDKIFIDKKAQSLIEGAVRSQ